MIGRMKQLSIYFLAFLTFWVSTWMVTDIHGNVVSSGVNQAHPFFSAQQAPIDSDLAIAIVDHHDTDCSVCSYDHNGHMGQTLATSPFIDPFIEASQQNIFLHAKFWYSRYTSPKNRPPIV